MWQYTAQAVLNNVTVFMGQKLVLPAFIDLRISGSIWSDSRIFPAYLATFSILIGLVHILSQLELVRKPLGGRAAAHDEASLDGKSHLKGSEERKILGFQIIRFISCFFLLALHITTLVLETRGDLPSKSNPNAYLPIFTEREWLELAIILTYTYASVIALVVLCAQPKVSKITNMHLVSLLLGTYIVFAFRNLYPLATFTLKPLDLSEGWLMYSKLGVLIFAAVVIPLTIPNRYVPFDLKSPAPEPNPEQTASWFSWLLYFFLDPIILQASRVPHLPLSQFPPIADYDLATNLVKTSFPYMDPLSPKAKGHIFWAILRVFSHEWTTMVILNTFQAVVVLLKPLAVNRLLSYLEEDGKNAFFRPWVWVLALFISPFLLSLSWQWYVFLSTRTMVRVQGIITHLVFEHALRIRMKAETSEKSQSVVMPVSTAVASETASAVDSLEERDQGGGEAAASTILTSDSAPDPSNKGINVGAEVSAGSSEEHTKNIVGKLNNLVSTDLNNIVEGRDFLMIGIGSPIQIGCFVYFLYTILGWSAFVGMGAMIALFPVPGYFAKLMQSVQSQKMKLTDSRVEAVSEVMNTIRMVKLFGWGSRMNDRLADKREAELELHRKRLLLEICNNSANFLIPVVVMVVTFACYTLVMKEDLTASRVFSAMAVFDLFRDEMFMVFGFLPNIIQAKVSLDRVVEFLYQTELLDAFTPAAKGVNIADNIKANKELVGFRNAAFTWSNEPRTSETPGSSRGNFTLRIDEELIFKKGKINLVVGPTGCGKTSLLMALLSELHFVPSGPDSWYNLPRDAGVAYAAQEYWVQNETIRENILFGCPFNEIRYKKVIEQCGLVRDLSLFEAGDETEVGEKGLSLSGGQKARITLARAIYSSAEIILLDDVLAALDVHTARWVVDNCLSGDLVHGRTVILVTHNIAMTSPIADFVVSLGTDGRVVSQGTFSAALKLNKALFAEVREEKKLLERDEKAAYSDASAFPRNEGNGKLITAEEISEGRVSRSAYQLFFGAMGGSSPAMFWALAIITLGVADISMVGQTWYLSYWASQYEKTLDHPIPVVWYLSTYSLLLIFASIIYSIATYVFIFGSLRASRTLHKKLINSVLGTTLRWLDSTPVARVISRCTQDMQAVDGPISQNFQIFSEITMSMLMKFAAVVAFTPIFLFPGLVVALLGAWCGQIYLKAQLCVKREMSNARSPVLSHFGAAVAGIVSIRAYQAQDALRAESLKRIDNYTRTARTFYNLNRWVSIRIDTFGALFSAALAAYLVYRPSTGHESGRAAQAGFSINMAVGFSSLVLWWVRFYNDFEVAANSLERIQQYVTIEQEDKSADNPPAYWPASGDLRVENLYASYTLEGPNVLHDVSFHIASGERVGVVGRTGSGKSSLTLALLRCINTSGHVYFDHLDTSKINLDALRSNVTIIPQVPELLSGSLRENLDPFDQHDDVTLNDALRSAGLFSIQNETDDGRITLETSIASGGSNLSVGQRQILALARAIIRGSKLLILDEATSAIDYATDTAIQEYLRHRLNKDVTLFTIAHRLQTIMDADKIMVLDAGSIVEFGKPRDLLNILGGKLKALVDESGDKVNLYKMANFEA